MREKPEKETYKKGNTVKLDDLWEYDIRDGSWRKLNSGATARIESGFAQLGSTGINRLHRFTVIVWIIVKWLFNKLKRATI